ncbi:transcription initiation protein [Streptosporangiaceae bacterium NEAU-GS5]|nr:transcription initiation protein [Streptosporangiaceae bacterium NEAU-GS5]
MQYVLMLCADQAAPGSSDWEEAMAGCISWAVEMEARGVLLGGIGLRPSADATTVRVRDAGVLLGDGPFTDTKEQLDGFSVIECENLDEAIDIASQHPWARVGLIEVRPVWAP